MASGFSSAQHECEGRRCTAKGAPSLASYLVNETQVLCPDCAGEKLSVRAVVPTVCGMRGVFYCAKHEGKRAENYCDTHGVLVCAPCALASHQSTCDLKVTEDALEEKVQTLNALLEDAMKWRERMCHIDADVNRKVASNIRHIRGVRGDIEDFFNDKRRQIIKRQQMRDEKTRKDAEKEVKLINARRDTRLQESAQEAEEEREKVDKEMNDNMALLQEALEDSNLSPVTAKLKQLIDSADEATTNASNLLCNVDRVLQDGKTVEESLRGLVDARADVDLLPVEEGLETIRGIKFTPGTNGCGTLEGIRPKVWSWAATIRLSKVIEWPRIGFVTDNTVLVQDIKTKRLYSVNLERKHTLDLEREVDDFAVWKSDWIATVFDHHVSIWSTNWDKLDDIIIATCSQGCERCVANRVAFDCRGNLLVKVHSRQIYVIDMITKEATKEISVKVKEVHDILGLDSGDILVKASRNKFITVDANGVQKQKIQRTSWDKASLSQDRGTDHLYAVYINKEHQVLVDVISSSGNTTPEAVEVDQLRLDPRLATHCGVFKSQKMCIINGDNLHIFQK